MSNETKRDVLKKALDFFVMRGIEQSINYDLKRYQYLSEYDAALPDDMPVIPEEVSDRLKQAKADRSSLRYMFAASSINMLSDWWMAQDPENEDTFARAWMLGVWRVEETGEIVKLEAEK
ncbi:hypothetical protein [Lacticaseibacillus paracasei]|uniref:hypothetical protein n=1 Tax=Lacticaseibacillus paracasei TaxID=1597 RepID=UPI00019C9FF8|nr:hypothetical protein [Lacticaseibacillus paracasei]EEI66725.1 hypothetical protein HMPREF0530_2977 [Lacticaseibacillus paracasei subsp. paracasei ATCC 25302 = DSM 5622 = JCM 8130]KRM61913.1 hypothetical protein FC74_GL000372 [Lacticaseibacillus paracasei subsp. paracasei ATCC 25302 = DSM 5622 = JCM 8130]MBA4475381.1 hypothetical protein [Lacticaseibacillus paracasei]TDG87578.1 hypothetical protein C5L26_002820 [Lacticaseibacillus paracasei subsp. paracasei]BAN71081.1 conserved hypothetical 